MENRMENKMSKLVVLFLAVALTASIAQADLVGHWPFEEGSGDTTADVTGNGYDGTFVGTPTWDSGPEGFGGGLLFDVGGSGDGVYCGTECNPGGTFTLAMWAYWLDSIETVQTQHFMTKSDGWNVATMMWQWELHANAADTAITDKIRIACQGTAGTTLSSSIMPANEWVHLAVTFDGTNAQLFINGIADAMGPVAFSIGTKTDAQFFIGKNYITSGGSARSFDGYLDEARVYSHVLSQGDIQMLMATDKAVNISPTNGASLVAVDTDLSWGPPPVFTPSKYDLRYKVGDPNFATGDVTVVSDIAYADPCNTHNPSGDFANDTTVYWRIDSYAPSYPSDPCTGDTWSFTTAPAQPVVTGDPVSLTVAIGGTAVFTVEDIGGTDYVWKKQSDGLTVGTGPVLTLTDVQTDPCEDSYYCIVSNASGSAPPSAAAGLWTKRLIARWEFEDDLADSEADGWDGDYVDPNTANPDPTASFVSGIEGQALSLVADALHVRITDSADYFNFYPQGYTVNAWVKTEQAADYGCIASKQDRGEWPDWDGWVLSCNNTGKASNALRQVFGSNTGTPIVSTSDIADNQWHMVTGTYDGETGTGSIYVDGKLENQLVDTERKAATNAYPVVLGAETVFAELAVYEGLLDKTSIYSYALGPIEVAVLYTDVAGGNICLEFPEYDFNEDCRIDILDFAMLATDWLECNIVPTCMP